MSAQSKSKAAQYRSILIAPLIRKIRAAKPRAEESWTLALMPFREKTVAHF
jgi:hypothetical protein